MRKKLTKLSLILFTLQILFTGLFAQDERKAELVVQTGHTYPVLSVVFSPDGNIIASGSSDNTVKLWDVESGKELRTLSGHTYHVQSVAFSPDGKIIASGSDDNTIKLWDVESGKELRTLSGHTDYVQSVAFSPDGKIIASGSDDNTIKLWNVSSGQGIRTLRWHSDKIKSVAFSPNGKIIASGSQDDTIKLWDVESGKEIRTLRGHTSTVSSIAFSPDGKLIASGSWDYTIKLWDVESGKEIRSLRGHSDVVNSVTFSLDGIMLASKSSDDTVKLLYVESGKELRTLNWDIYGAGAVAFSPNSKIIASGGRDDTIKLWDVESGKEIRTLRGHIKEVYSVAFSPDDTKIASGNKDTTITFWRVASGQKLLTLEGHNSSVQSVAFSPDGRMLASGSSDNTIKLWDVSSGKEIRTLRGHTSTVRSVAFSPDGKLIASGSRDKIIKLWDVASGQEIHTLSGHTFWVWSVAFSPDGRMLASGSWDNTIKLWDVASGQELRTLRGHSNTVNSIAFSPDGKIIASGSWDDTVKLWDVTSKKPTKSFDRNDPKTIAEVFAVIPDFYKKNDNDPVSSNGKFQVKQGENGKLNLYEFKTYKLLASLIQYDKKDWAVVTPDGLFDATPNAREFMHYIIGLEPIALEQMKDLYYVPGLLQKIFKGEPLPKVELFSKKDLFPLAKYEQPKPDQKVLDVKLTNRGGGIGQVQVIVNGKEFIKDARPAGFDSKQATLNLKIPLENAPFILGEKNKIEVVSRNAVGSLSSRGSSRGVETFQTFNYGIKREKPNVYAIIGGVSDYTGDGLDLKYAAKDAEDFAKAFEAGANNLFGADKVHIRLLTSNDENSKVQFKAKDAKISKATKQDFLQAFADFKKATPNDIFIIYLAGHGVSIKTNREQVGGDLYLYLTQEAYTPDMSDKKLRDAMAISSDELTELMKQNKALKQVLVLDTCAAGGAVEAINSLVAQRNLPNKDAQIRAIDRLNDRTGFFVLMGSAANKVSYEAGEYGQGLLTYSLLEGMKGAKLREGEFADVSLLFNYAQDKVPTLAKDIGGIQRPLVIAPDFVRESSNNKPETSGSFDIGRFTKSEQNQISLSTKKPRILKPRLINSVTISDDLELEVMLRKALRNASFALERSGQNGNQPTSIVFVEADEMSDAIKPNGLYTIDGEKIELTLNLIRNKKRIKTIKISGNKNAKGELIKQIIEVLEKLEAK